MTKPFQNATKEQEKSFRAGYADQASGKRAAEHGKDDAYDHGWRAAELNARSGAGDATAALAAWKNISTN